MFIILLKFATHRSRAAEFLDAHRAWIARGFDDGVFLLTGSLDPSLGGIVVAHRASRSELERRINDDPFVAQQVVVPEILEISPSRASGPLEFLTQESQP